MGLTGITLRQLATHTSGLPRLAPNHDKAAVDLANPYARFGPAHAEEGLRQAVPAPGRPHLYSNFGYQLLGLVLERASGLPCQRLIRQRLLEPLAMTCSGQIHFDPSGQIAGLQLLPSQQEAPARPS